MRGELLRQWRLAQELEPGALARRVNLSAAQIQQLESGGSSLFYSEAIKYNAARKVAAALGGDPDSVIRSMAGDEGGQSIEQMSLQVLDDLIQLSEQRKKAQQESSSNGWHFFRLLMWLTFLASLAWGAFWLTQHTDLAKRWLSLLKTQLAAVTAGPASAAVVAEASAPPAASPEASAPADSASLAIASLAGAMAASSSPASTSPLSATQVALSSPEALCQSTEQGTLLTSKIPSKAGDMVYIVPLKAGSVCAKDGTGKSTVLTLQAKEGRSVYGPPPWRLYFEHADQAQVYFQGERLRWPELPTRAIVLREVKPQ
ncbi:helix-turn-helix domain-containing protein [Limnohabitans planktonicus]|uniref:helix-turn-helix domain-containing protein n=1 Tax=Limnohabitans planktonicus TaxID=540060 RepID=UPI001401DC44|nr:helix-turn-helix transcriptional regulator [Limnohabitans planktonicus]